MERENPGLRLTLTHKFVILALLLVGLEVLSMTAYPALKHQRSPFGQAFKLRSLMTAREGFQETPLDVTPLPNHDDDLDFLLKEIEQKNQQSDDSQDDEEIL